MNPLEHLRYLARIEAEDPVDLALEAAYIIAELASDRSLLVSALRRLLDRHPGYGILWMLAARISGSVFPEEEAWNVVGELSMPRRDHTSAGSLSLQVSRNGRLAVSGDAVNSIEIGYDAERGIEFLRSRTDASLVVESDLVSSRFAVIPQLGSRLIDGFTDKAGGGRILIRGSDFSVVPESIKESLEYRLARDRGRDSTELRCLDGTWTILYQGSSLSASIAERLVGWRVPQEVLRSAGPMLG